MLESVPGPRWDVPVINAFPQNKVQGYTSIAVPSSSAGQSYMLLILFTLASFFLAESWSSIGHVGPSSPICQNSIFCNPRRPLIRTWIWNKLSIKVCFKHFILTMKIQHLMITYMIFKSVSVSMITKYLENKEKQTNILPISFLGKGGGQEFHTKKLYDLICIDIIVSWNWLRSPRS